MRCLLVDDELPALDELSYLLSEFPDVEIVGTARSASQALEKIARLAPDVVFQDIQMPGATGFTVLEHAMCLARPPLFVFATAYDQYAIRAFEDNAVDYLLKPVSRTRLAICIDRLRHLLGPDVLQQPARQPGLDSLLHSMGPGLLRIPVEHGGRMLLLCHEDVVFMRTEDRRIRLYTTDRCFFVHGGNTLDRWEDKLTPLSFFRANRSELVNLARIRDFAPWLNGKYVLTMCDAASSEITVSKARTKAFREQLDLA